MYTGEPGGGLVVSGGDLVLLCTQGDLPGVNCRLLKFSAEFFGYIVLTIVRDRSLYMLYTVQL